MIVDDQKCSSFIRGLVFKYIAKRSNVVTSSSIFSCHILIKDFVFPVISNTLLNYFNIIIPRKENTYIFLSPTLFSFSLEGRVKNYNICTRDFLFKKENNFQIIGEQKDIISSTTSEQNVSEYLHTSLLFNLVAENFHSLDIRFFVP